MLMVACSTPDQGAPALSAERQQLRAEGVALYDRVSWTYQNRNAAALARQLTQRHSDPDQVMGLLPLEPGDRVADIGSGVGFFTFRLAKAAGPEGRVLALDIQPESIEVLRARGKDRVLNPYDNVESRLTAVDDCQLEPRSLDMLFMSHLGFYLHSELMNENVTMLACLPGALGPDGHLVVLEYIPPGLTVDYLVPNFEAAGFQLHSSQYFEKHQSWLFVFRPTGKEAGE